MEEGKIKGKFRYYFLFYLFLFISKTFYNFL